MAALLVLAAAMAVPFLVPVSRFIPELARVASEKLNQPVAIESLALHIVPTPRIVAQGIRVGKKSEITVGELEIVPDLLSLLSGPRAIRLVRAERVELQEGALAIPRSIRKSEGGEPVVLRRLLLEDMALHHSALHLPRLNADVRLKDDLRVEQAKLETRDGALRLELDGNGKLSLAARNWSLPVVTALSFESLEAHGTYRDSRLELSQVEGLLYGGKLTGSARASWTRQWQLSGKASVAGVDLAPVQTALGKPARLSGRLKADAVFSAQAGSAGALADALLLEGPFEVLEGVYQGVDLSKAGDITGAQAWDDATSFEELSGRLQMQGRRIRIRELCVRSPAVVAGGHVEIGPDQSLSGKLDVSIAKTAGFVGVPVALGGTTGDPTIRPTKGYMIGAVIGTVILPGIGTTLGASAGSRLEGGASGCR